MMPAKMCLVPCSEMTYIKLHPKFILLKAESQYSAPFSAYIVVLY